MVTRFRVRAVMTTSIPVHIQLASYQLPRKNARKLARKSARGKNRTRRKARNSALFQKRDGTICHADPAFSSQGRYDHFDTCPYG